MPVLVDHDAGSEELGVILCVLSGYCQEMASYVHSTRHLTLFLSASLSLQENAVPQSSLFNPIFHFSQSGSIKSVTVPSILSSGTCLALLQGSSISSSRETECSDALL